MSEAGLYFRQLLSGRDFAPNDDVASLLGVIAADGMTAIGALATHYHPDHVGGDLFGHRLEGIAEFVGQAKAKVWVHESEAEGVRTVTGVSASDLTTVRSGDTLRLDGV